MSFSDNSVNFRDRIIKISMNCSQPDPTHDDIRDMANILRIHCIEMTEKAESGHPTTCSSIAEIMSVLFFHEQGMHYDPSNPSNFLNDRLVLSKGHAAPILYAAWARAGFLDRAELIKIRDHTSDLEGHPTPRLPFVDIATGSLGQGLGVACGMAYSSKYLDGINNVYFTIMGDAETGEGSVWEAASFASFYSLNNMIAFVDVNRLGQGTESMLKHDVLSHSKRFEAFGWETIIIDGHNISELISALKKARTSKDKPTCIIAKTFKGKHFIKEVEDNIKWHGKVLGKTHSENTIQLLRSLIKNPEPVLVPTFPSGKPPQTTNERTHFILPSLTYQKGKEIATRIGVGTSLRRLGYQNINLVVLDAETKTSTYSCLFQDAHPQNFVECYISEQNMISVACGLHARGKITFSNSFGAFLTRAYDQVRMAGISKANLKIHGSHSGVSVGEDGPSQMGLEDIALYKPIPGMSILYPSDAVSAEKAVEIAANTYGLFYIRSSRPGTPVIYENDEHFELGKCKVVKRSENDMITVVGAGITLHEALIAQKVLEEEGIRIRVIDVFSVKPIDAQGLIKNARQTKNMILTVEDHYINGGIRDSVCAAVKEEDIKVVGLGLEEIPRSGKCHDLLKMYGIEAEAIINKIKELLNII